MTSRLKRKLNDLGVDPSSSKANESFCLIGTPLPPLEKSKDTGEFVPLWKQDVRDEKGRRRLHGAFTGGFSAGYFNTVGSKEGWAPSTFVSSRSDRAKAKAARAEDFMDEEDLAELHESRKLVDENEEMDFGGTEAELRRRAGAGADNEPEKDSITAALEASLAPGPKDSVGARILKKMGWRMGQGIGPRLTHAQRKAQDAGFLDSWKETEGDEEDEEAKKHLYPRRDTPVLLASRKGNFHGLGYVPGMRLEESVGSGHDGGRDKGPRISAGFGLGALNETEEDDMDIYDNSVSHHGRTRMAYDAADERDGRHIATGASGARPSTRGQETRVTSTTHTQTFNDGRAVLKGFVLSESPVAEDRWFPLPDIPKGWTPNPHRVWDQEKNKENVEQTVPTITATKTHAQWKDSFMSADERGAMLGETPLPSKPRSVFEYISQKDRERLENIKNAIPGPSPSATAPMPPPPTPHVRGEIDIPYLHPSVAKAALQGFQPFTSDPVKQSRYTAFLNFQANRGPVMPGAQNQTGIGIGPSPGQSVEEFNKELQDYAKAATVFKPLSGAMADRFRSAVVVETGPVIIEGLHQPVPPTAQEEADARKEQEEKEEKDPKMAAVRLGMYGPLTREVHPWQPARLLCKRFGVKDPEVDVTGDASATADFAPTAAAKGSELPDAAAADVSSGPSTSGLVSAGAITDGSDSSQKRGGPRDLANVGLGEDDTQGRDTLTYQRPPMDIFKAIFASDEEDSSDEEAADDVIVKQELESTSVEPTPQTDVQVKSEPVPSHLEVGDASSYKQNGSVVSPTVEKVDLTSFKPTFIPRKDKSKDKDRDKKDKDKKKKSANKVALMSFDVEEDGLAPTLSKPARRDKEKGKEKDRERKKKRKGHKEEDEDDNMWVEAPAPEVVKSIATDVPPAAESTLVAPAVQMSIDSNTSAAGEARLLRGRKRAIDFM